MPSAKTNITSGMAFDPNPSRSVSGDKAAFKRAAR